MKLFGVPLSVLTSTAQTVAPLLIAGAAWIKARFAHHTAKQALAKVTSLATTQNPAKIG